MPYDAHIHAVGIEEGGFVIGLEGEPKFEGTLNNEAVLSLHGYGGKYLSFVYVSSEVVSQRVGHPYLKYHARRERYSPGEVVESIRLNKPKGVIVDTLNEPYWVAYDYWRVARAFPDTPFVFAHSGGYLVNDFLKICHFQSNVWLDFALTHTTLGRYGGEGGLPYVNEAIVYALTSPFRNRVLMSSDYPFFSQEDVFHFYGDYVDMLDGNFERLFEMIR